MFAKLLKYDFRSNAGLLGLLSVCTLGMGCVAAVVLRLLTANWDTIMEKENVILLLIPAILFLFIAYLAIVFYSAAVHYINLFRFYKSRFTDEGYLMFTLPVKTSHIFLSGAASNALWSLISLLVVATSLAIAIGLGPIWPQEITAELKWIFQDMQSVFSDVITPGYPVVMVISSLVAFIYGIIVSISAVVLGATIAKKYKVLAIIGVLIGISMVTSMIGGFISGIMEILMLAYERSIGLITTVTPLIFCVLYLALIVGGYFLSVHLMKKKLNLP